MMTLDPATVSAVVGWLVALVALGAYIRTVRLWQRERRANARLRQSAATAWAQLKNMADEVWRLKAQHQLDRRIVVVDAHHRQEVERATDDA